MGDIGSGAPGDPSECEKNSYMDKCLQGFVTALRDKPGNCRRLAKAFPEIYAENPEALTLVSDEFGKKFTTLLENSTAELLGSMEMKQKLEELQKLAVSNDGTWRPSGDAEKDMKAHIALLKQNEITALQQDIEKEQKDQMELKEILAKKESLIKKKLLHANSVVEDLTSACQVVLSEQNRILNSDNLQSNGKV